MGTGTGEEGSRQNEGDEWAVDVVVAGNLCADRRRRGVGSGKSSSSRLIILPMNEGG